MSTIPTVQLQQLFLDLDFLAAAKEGLKPCFNRRYYVDKDSYYGSLLRYYECEKQSVYGNSKIAEICKNASETSSVYLKSNKYFYDILLEKIIEARKGLERIARTYENIDISTASTIRILGILVLDGVIPEEYKIREGFILPKEETGSIDV